MTRTAAALRRQAGGRNPLPGLLFFTDPARTPDIEATAKRLPRGSAIVYRSFGAAGAQDRALGLRAIGLRRGLVLLIGADEALAARVHAHGVHLPQRLAHRARALKARGYLVTAAAHSLAAARRALAYGADAEIGRAHV